MYKYITDSTIMEARRAFFRECMNEDYQDADIFLILIDFEAELSYWETALRELMRRQDEGASSAELAAVGIAQNHKSCTDALASYAQRLRHLASRAHPELEVAARRYVTVVMAVAVQGLAEEGANPYEDGE